MQWIIFASEWTICQNFMPLVDIPSYNLELVTVRCSMAKQCAAFTIFNRFYVICSHTKTLNSLVDGFIYPLKAYALSLGHWQWHEQKQDQEWNSVSVFRVFDEKSTWFHSVEYLHASVWYLCVFFHPWHRCDVFVWSQCRIDDFPSD